MLKKSLLNTYYLTVMIWKEEEVEAFTLLEVESHARTITLLNNVISLM